MDTEIYNEIRTLAGKMAFARCRSGIGIFPETCVPSTPFCTYIPIATIKLYKTRCEQQWYSPVSL